MECGKCKKTVDNRVGLAVNDKLTHGQYWCRACVIAAGGKFPESLVLASDIEARMQHERAERIAARKLHIERRVVNEKRALHRKVKKFTKARKKATLLITRLLRT